MTKLHDLHNYMVLDGEARFWQQGPAGDVSQLSLSNMTAKHLLFRVRSCRSARLDLEAKVSGQSYSKYFIEIGADDNTKSILSRPRSRKPLVSRVRITHFSLLLFNTIVKANNPYGKWTLKQLAYRESNDYSSAYKPSL